MKKQPGFTIVELLVVIVVIGILASITIVSYSGISQNALVASLQSDTSSSSRQLEVFRALNNENYPDTINCPTDTVTNKCIKLSSGTSVAYYYSDNTTINKTYLLVLKNKSLYYAIAENMTPTKVSEYVYYTNAVGDGSVGLNGANWSSVRSAGSGYVNTDPWSSTANPVYFPGGYSCPFGCQYDISRVFLPFDTSTLGAGEQIIGGYVGVTVGGSGTNMTTYLTSSSQALSSNLTGTDYPQVGSISFSKPTNLSISSGYIAVAYGLNTSGLLNITKSGYSKYAIRSYADMFNISNTNNDNPLSFKMAEDASIGNRPKLVVYVKS